MTEGGQRMDYNGSHMPENSIITKPSLDRLPGVLDRQISSASADFFGHDLFAIALRDLVESPACRPPFSIGLLGGWGTGKSSIKEIYVNGLTEDRSKDQGKSSRNERFHTVTFNAWRFGGENNIKRALLRSVFVSLGGSEDDLTDRLYHQVQKPTLTARSGNTIIQDLYEKWLWVGVQLLVVLAALIGFTYVAKAVLHLSDEWVTWAVLAVGALAGASWLRFILDPKRFVIPRYTNVTRVELPALSTEQYESFLAEQLRKFKQNHAKCERVVVFVDDLDRLSAEEMVSGLDAVRALMEISAEGADVGIVFVISCDEDKVAEALGNRRKKNGSDLPGVIFNQADARRYLDRIFQFRLEIPPMPRQDMRSFALGHLSRSYPGLVDELALRGTSLEEVVSIMIHVAVTSPRNALQIVNAFTQTWWLASQREWRGAGSDKPGGLSTGAVTAFPAALAGLSALRVDFPDFYAQLVNQPDLIQRFVDVFVDKVIPATLPEGLQMALGHYAQKAEDASVPWEINSSYRPLRRFLSSMTGISWPASTQPLLLLAQDPITRRSGDIGRQVFDGLVSGDADSVLEALGRDKDLQPLSLDHVRLIASVLDEVDADTDDRKDRACSTLVSIIDRLLSASDLVTVRAARRLALSHNVRYRAGIDKVSHLLRQVPAHEQRSLATCLVRDFANAEGRVLATLPTGGPPTLEQAIQMTRTAVSAVLGVRSIHGIPEADDQMLLSWLATRNVAVPSGQQQLPFDVLEGWMDRHEATLLGAMSGVYLDVVSDEISAITVEQDLASTMRRCRTVLDTLWNLGEDGRKKVIETLTRFAASRTVPAGTLAQTFFRLNLPTMNDNDCSLFVTAMSGRLSRYNHDSGTDEVDTDAIDLSTLTVTSNKKLSKEANEALVGAADALSKFDLAGPQAAQLARTLLGVAESESTDLLAKWTARVFVDLPDACVALTANEIDRVSTSTEKEWVALMDMAATEAFSDIDRAKRYELVFENIPDTSLANDTYSPHVAKLLTLFNQRHSDLESLDYLSGVLVRAVTQGSPTIVGTPLNTIARNSAGYPVSYAALFRYLKGSWPPASPTLAPYDPTVVFTSGRTVAEANPSAAFAPDFLVTLDVMRTNGLVIDSVANGLLDTALVLWPWHRAEAGAVIASMASRLTATKVAELAVVVQEGDIAVADALRTIWSTFASNNDCMPEVARELLASPPKAIFGETDWALNFWFDASGSEAGIGEALVGDKALTDEQRLRAWNQLARQLPLPSVDATVSAIKVALLATAEVAMAAIESIDSIRGSYRTEDEKFNIGQQLMRLVPEAQSLESKRRLIDSVSRFHNPLLAKTAYERGSAFSEEDRRLTFEKFPKDKRLKKEFQ